MVAKCILSMHITAELKACWFCYVVKKIYIMFTSVEVASVIFISFLYLPCLYIKI